MNPPRNRDFFADIQILYETRVSSPGNAWNIIGFIIRSVHGNQYVRNFTRKRRGSVYGRFADIARKDDIVVLAGKGQEKYQIIGDSYLPFCEAEIVKDIMMRKGNKDS